MDSKHAWPLVKGACPIALSGQQTNKNTNKLIKARKRKTKKLVMLLLLPTGLQRCL